MFTQMRPRQWDFMMFETGKKNRARNERKQNKQQVWYVQESKSEANIDIERGPWVNGYP